MEYNAKSGANNARFYCIICENRPEVKQRGGIYAKSVFAVLYFFLIVVKKFAETLEVNDFSFAKEFYNFVYVRVVGKPQNVVVGSAGFLFCCTLLRHYFYKLWKIN